MESTMFRELLAVTTLNNPSQLICKYKSCAHLLKTDKWIYSSMSSNLPFLQLFVYC